MTIRLGVIEYNRSSRPIKADSIMQILAVSSKAVIRLAWSSLNPYSDNSIRTQALATWFCEFFNLVRNDNQGYKCIKILCDMNILNRRGEFVKPAFDL